jgi:hypothetical protein
MRVIARRTKCGFRVIEANEVRFEDGSVIVTSHAGEEFKVGRHKSWDDKKVEAFLEQEAAYDGRTVNLSPLSLDHSKWLESPF